MENKKVLLKTAAFGGYEKKSVHSFMFELNESAQEAQQRLQERIDELTQARDASAMALKNMEEQIMPLQRDLENIKNSLGSEMRKNENSTAMIDKLNAEIVHQQELLTQKNAEIAELVRQVGEMESSRDVEIKRQEVEQAASQINMLLMKARSDADVVKNEARVQADAILNEARSKSAAIVEKARDDASGIVNEAHSEARRITALARTQAEDIQNGAVSAARESAKEADGALQNLYRQFSIFCAEIDGAKQALANTVSSINKKISGLDQSIESARTRIPKNMEGVDFIKEYIPDRKIGTERPQHPPEPVEKAVPQTVAREPGTGSNLTDQILSQYGIRKDESGFFRLSPDD